MKSSIPMCFCYVEQISTSPSKICWLIGQQLRQNVLVDGRVKVTVATHNSTVVHKKKVSYQGMNLGTTRVDSVGFARRKVHVLENFSVKVLFGLKGILRDHFCRLSELMCL